MKRMKGIFVMAGFGVVLFLSGCGIFSKKPEKEKVTLIIKTAPLMITNAKDAKMDESYQLLEKAGEEFAAQYDKADVDIKVVKFEYKDEKEYIEDCYDTEDAADILLKEYHNATSYIYGGRVVPVDDILSKKQNADFIESTWRLSQINGKAYMLPYYNLQNTLCYNKELFRQCGLSEFIKDGVIQSWSLQEWNRILDTLAEKLPKMHYPMMMYALNNQGDAHIMTLLRSHGSQFFDEDKKFHVNTEEGIAALKWIQDGYEKGYFPQGCENMELTDCIELFNNNQLAICMQNTPYLLGKNDDFGLVNFPDINGNGFSTCYMMGFMVFDNGNPIKLQTAKDFLSFFYGQEEYLEYERSGIPSNKSVTEKSRDFIYFLDAYEENQDTIVNFTGNNPNWQGSHDSVRNVFWKYINRLLKGIESPEQAAAGIDRDCNEAIEAAVIKIHE